MINFSSETIEFIRNHKNEDVRTLALQAKRYPQVDMNQAVTQIAGRQIAEKKIPSWATNDNIVYPKHLSMEQCSSEITARYKAQLVCGETFADITAGFGVDCSFISQNFKHAHYVERQEELCNIAKHNFNVLGLTHIEVHNMDGVEFLKTMDKVDCLFLDPARRDSNGGKTVAISECEPDVSSLENLLVEKGKIVMIKLSPMLDMHSALNELKFINRVHIISVNNECKELTIMLKKEDIDSNSPYNTSEKEIVISCEQVVNNLEIQHFDFTYSEEKNAKCMYTEIVGRYLYEPGAALLKAGPYKLLSDRFGTKKLHPNSHLYTSDEYIEFPGRRFEVIETSTFGKKELKAFMQGLEKANLTVRNFPATVADLRKKLKLKEGGDTYIFATTLNNGEKTLIKCRQAKL